MAKTYLKIQSNDSPAPFYVGQDVVAIVDLAINGRKFLTKGADYKIGAIKQCSCGLWVVQVGLDLSSVALMVGCFKCGAISHETRNVWLGHNGFVPKEPLVEKSEMTFEEVMKMVEPKELIEI